MDEPTGTYNYVGKRARWKRRLYTASSWRQLYTPLHYLLSLMYLSVLKIKQHELHVAHLGASRYMAGTTLWLLGFELLGQNAESNMDQVWADVVV